MQAKYEISINKVDASGGEEVPGAELTLNGTDSDGNAVMFEEGAVTLGEGASLINGVGSNIAWISGTTSTKVLLEDGEYKLHEIAAPTGYEIANDIKFKIENGKIVSIVINDVSQDVTNISEIEMIDERIVISTSTTTTTTRPSIVGNDEEEVSGTSSTTTTTTTTTITTTTAAAEETSTTTQETTSSPYTGDSRTGVLFMGTALAASVMFAVRKRRK